MFCCLVVCGASPEMPQWFVMVAAEGTADVEVTSQELGAGELSTKVSDARH